MTPQTETAGEEPLRRGVFYRAADYDPKVMELTRRWGYMVRWTGEHRPPRKGEWYLSGAIIEGYKAKNDLSDAFHIGQLCRVKRRVVYEVEEVLS
jgi:hypothetical protein